MKRTAATLWLSIALYPVFVPGSAAGAREDAFSAVSRWAEAYSSADVEKVVASYTPDAVFWGTSMENVATTPEGIRAYFADLPQRSPRSSVKILEYSAVEVTPDVVVFAGLCQFARGDKLGTLARFTFVSVRRGDRWLLSHHHSSSRPSGTGR